MVRVVIVKVAFRVTIRDRVGVWVTVVVKI